MPAKRPIDQKRDSAISGTIGVAGDGAIKEFLNVGHSLLMIMDEAIYKFELADRIDPERTNIAVPNTQQKLYSVGYSSEIVGRILLTAKYLFEKGMLDGRFDKARLMSASLQFFDEIIAAAGILENLKLEHDAAIALFEKQKADKSAILIPSVADVRGKVKSFIQRTEHSMQPLLALCQICLFAPSRKDLVRQFRERRGGKAFFGGERTKEHKGDCKIRSIPPKLPPLRRTPKGQSDDRRVGFQNDLKGAN